MQLDLCLWQCDCCQRVMTLKPSVEDDEGRCYCTQRCLDFQKLSDRWRKLPVPKHPHPS